MTPRFNTAKKYKELGQNTLIKVLGFERTTREGKTSFQINKLCIISQDPGHRFGNPLHYFDVYDDSEDDDDLDEEDSDDDPGKNKNDEEDKLEIFLQECFSKEEEAA